MEEDLKHNELSRKIIGSAMKVHTYLGNGFREIIYQRSLAIELSSRGIMVECEVDKPVFYKEQLVGRKRLDLIVEQCIIIEIKAVTALDNGCMQQILNYLKVFDLEVGLLLNFGAPRLEIKRLVN